MKSFTRLNMYGLWGEDCYASHSHSDSSSSSNPSAQGASRLSTIDRAEVSRSSTLYFDSHKELAEALFNSEEHSSEVKFLCALAAKIRLLFPSSSTETQYREQRVLLKIMLSDLQSSHSDRRAGARLVLSFLAAPLCPSPDNSAGAASHSYTPLLPQQHVQDTSSNTLPSPSSLGDAVRLAFVRGPSLVDFTSLLIGLCRLSDRTINNRSTYNNSEAVINAMVELQKNSVVESLLVVAADETECNVLVQMLGALHALHDQLTSVSQSSTTAANVLLNMYVTRRLTSEYLLASLLRNRRIEFLAAVLSRDIERVKVFGTVDADRGSASIGSNGVILTKPGGSGLDQSIHMDVSTLKMLLFIALEASRHCDKCGHVLDNIEVPQLKDHHAASGAFPLKSFKECASIILSASTTKDCKVHFLPLIAVALCNASATSRSDPLFSLVDATLVSKISECSSHSPVAALLPFIVELSASSLLDLLTVLSSERQAGPGSSPLIHSGLSTEILKVIVDTIDSKLISIPGGSRSSANEVWHLLIKPYSAKKLERIQCELQPLVLEVFALASAEPSESGSSPKYWALHSAALTGLFTLKELRSPTLASIGLVTASLYQIEEKENATASIESTELEPLSSSFHTNTMSTSTSLPLLVRVTVEGEVTEMMPGVGRIAEGLVRGNLLEAFYAISDAITRITCNSAADADNKMKVVGEGRGEGAGTGETGHESLSQRVLPWFQGLLQSITRQSTQQCPSLKTVTCIASALISCQREDVLLALALTGMGCNTSEHTRVLLDTADISRVARLDFSSTRWCLCAHALVPLLSRDIKQALDIFLRGVAVFVPLATTVGTDGTVLFVLMRQLLSVLAEGIHHRRGRELTESILLIEDYSLKKKSQQDDDRTLEDAILRLLPAVRSFISLINDTVSAVGAGEAEDKVDHTHWLEDGLQCFTLPAGVRGRRRKATGPNDSSESRDLKHDGVDQDNIAREGLREESEKLLRFIVKFDDSSSHLWSDLTFSFTAPVPVS